jgi:hypothetical protein
MGNIGCQYASYRLTDALPIPIIFWNHLKGIFYRFVGDNILKGDFLDFFFICTIFNTASSAGPTVTGDAGIEPRTVATTALTV